jgi:hypothetical protein
MFSGHDSEVLLSVSPRQQLIDMTVGVAIDDAREDVGQIRERVADRSRFCHAVCSSSQPSFRRSMADADNPGSILAEEAPPAPQRSRQSRYFSGKGSATTSRSTSSGACSGRIDGENRMRPGSVASASRSRTRGWRTATGPIPDHHLALRRMTVADDALAAVPGLQIGMLVRDLGLDRLGQRRTRPSTQFR